jgi:alkylation response protein AidB-like acyl-CoA dehydrogenase
MDLALSEAELELRDQVRRWLGERLPRSPHPEGPEERFHDLLAWQRELFDGGWAGLSWPRAFGGGGADPVQQLIVSEELASAGAPEPANVVGIDVMGPVIMQVGTPEQQARYLPAILSGEEVWCQGFSEPDAGSDLAALRTRAVPFDGGFRVSGQKVWTSWAQFSRWCALLARTDPEVPKHQGISLLIIDMKSPGIDVRPLIQMTGDPEFSEVFLDNVFVPRENLLGDLDRGWQIATTTLMYERGPYIARRQGYLRTVAERLMPMLREANESLRQEAARALTDVEALRFHTYRRTSELQASGGPPGAETSIDKLFAGQTEQRLFDVAFELLGHEIASGSDAVARDWAYHFLYSRSATIYGGTAEIQRTVISERLLGLPRGSP